METREEKEWGKEGKRDRVIERERGREERERGKDK
jgi:hypothetical protein